MSDKEKKEEVKNTTKKTKDTKEKVAKSAKTTKTTKTKKVAKTEKTPKVEKTTKTPKVEKTAKANEESRTIEIENTEQGIEISSDVIAVIAGVAVSEVQGVASVSKGFAGGISEVLSGKKNLAKGIKVEKTENSAKIDVNIIVEYGTRIPDVAYEVQNRVKKAVESMTGFEVEEINVHVQGVNTNITSKEETEQKETKKSENDEN